VNSPTERATKPLPPLSKGDRNENPTGISLSRLLWEDFCTHEKNLFEQGFWAVALHRFGNWRMSVRVKILRAPLSILYFVLFKMVEMFAGICLPYTVKLGRRVRIWHFGSMILHARSIGNDVHIRQNTTFGVARTHDNLAIPIIEDGCDLACGVCVLGAVTVGKGSKIGANSVVLRDIPPYSVAVGAPAKVVKSLAPLPLPAVNETAAGA
jgi:serine O-acetyltransferase